MEKLKEFMDYLCGSFNNDNQLKEEKAATGEVRTLAAKHIVGMCNDKIKNIPRDFNGYFTIDETYYNNGEHETVLHHLFLYKHFLQMNITLPNLFCYHYILLYLHPMSC